MPKEIMLDIETLNNTQSSVIVSIGAVVFDFEKEGTEQEFYQRIDIDSCLDVGLTVSGGTIQWWLKQNEEARFAIGKDAAPIKLALINFCQFLNSVNVDNTKYNIWGNPASFDIGIVSNAFDKCQIKIPWHYRNERDLRTLVAF